MKNKERPYPEDKFVIALTGGIASGKSMVAVFLYELGAGIVDTDVIAREIVRPGSPVLDEIKKEWGEKMTLADGTLDRKAMGDVIFNSEKDREKLNSIMHPAIRRVMLEKVSRCKRKIVTVVIPLLYEAKVPQPHDEAWVVYCDEEQQLERLMERDDLTREQARARINSQMPIDEKVKKADVVIRNTGSIDSAHEETVKAWNDLLKRLEND